MSAEIKDPKQCSEVDLSEFMNLVREGGEVQANGLEARVRAAYKLAFLREAGRLIGVAALKSPSVNHRREVAESACAELPADSYPYELGWVFISQAARGRGLSFPMCSALLAEAAGSGIFATSRTNNQGMHATLRRAGFESRGGSYQSVRGTHRLQLFVLPPNNSLQARRP